MYIYLKIKEKKHTSIVSIKFTKKRFRMYFKCEFNDATHAYVCANECVYVCQQMSIGKSKHTTQITCMPVILIFKHASPLHGKPVQSTFDTCFAILLVLSLTTDITF